MDFQGSRSENFYGDRGNRILSAQLVNLHVYIVPVRLWRHHLRSALDEVVNDAVSAGFVRVLPQTTVYDLRTEISTQLDIDLIPKEFVFLSCVGRCFTKMRSKQEKQLKVKSFIPPQAPAPEIFILESDSEMIDASPSTTTYSSDSSRCSSLTCSELGSFSQVKLPPIGQQKRNDSEKHRNVGTIAPIKSKDGQKIGTFSFEKNEEQVDYCNDSFGDENFPDEEADKSSKGGLTVEGDALPTGRIIFEFFKSATRKKILAVEVKERLADDSTCSGRCDEIQRKAEGKCSTCANACAHHCVHGFPMKSIISNNAKECSCPENELCVYCHQCLPASSVSIGNVAKKDTSLQDCVDRHKRTCGDCGVDCGQKESERRCCLVTELNNLKKNREEMEKIRDELLAHKNSLLAALKISENKSANKDTWRKKYFIEKKSTLPVEESNNKLKKQLQAFNKKIISLLEQNAILHSTKVKNQSKARSKEEQEMTSMHLKFTQLQQETEVVIDKLENLKIRLIAEMKLRVQLEKDTKLLKLDFEHKKNKFLQFKGTFEEALP